MPQELPAGMLLDLTRRWPDADLAASLGRVSGVYRTLLRRQRNETGQVDSAASFARICRWIEVAACAESAAPERASEECRVVTAETRAILKRPDGLQRLASLLALVMHFAVDRRTADLLVNRRRPRKPFPTYPTTPALAHLVGESILGALLEAPTPRSCESVREAIRYAERTFCFRILDPSVESGQLLVGIAQVALDQIHRRHPADTRAGRLLGRAVLERLSAEVLWGVDRNELAIATVRLLFSILGHSYGIDRLTPTHIVNGNALHALPNGDFAEFDGLVNNPPWGVSMSSRERRRLRREFQTVEHRADLYVPFTEMATRSVRAGAALVLILPSQALAARNTRRLRALLLAKMGLERIVLLPRTAFADATVRSVVLVGRRQPWAAKGRCRVTTFPLIKRLDAPGEPHSFDLSPDAFAERGARSWMPLLSGGPFTNGSSRTLPLEELARVTVGVQVHHVGRGDPPQTREIVRRRAYLLDSPTNGAMAAVRGREVLPFRILEPERFVNLGRQLSWVGDHDELRQEQRVFVRELCRRDGQLSAAAATNGAVPLHGVLTVVPRCIDLTALLGILNSSSAADYVRRHAASFSKVDFQRITVTEMRRFPVPVAALAARERRSLGLPAPSSSEGALRRRLIALVRKIQQAQPGRDEALPALIGRLDETVGRMFELAG